MYSSQGEVSGRKAEEEEEKAEEAMKFYIHGTAGRISRYLSQQPESQNLLQIFIQVYPVLFYSLSSYSVHRGLGRVLMILMHF